MKLTKKLFSMILVILLMLQIGHFNVGDLSANTVSASANNVFYIDPVIGDINNNGSYDKPWSTLQEVIENNLIETFQPKSYPYDGTGSLVKKNEGAPVKAGDTIVLRNGYHGQLSILRAYNPDYITIKAQEGHTPKLSGISITSASKWHLKGLTISPEFAEQYQKGNIINIAKNGYSGSSYDIIIEGCTGYSVQDTSKWTADDWNTKSCSGITSFGYNISIENNYLKNVNFGISVSGNNSIVRNNTVENFAGDGLRGIADDLLFEGNVIKNCYDVNGNHDDGFQSWAVNGDPPERVTLRGNLFINNEDPNQPFVGTLQGIGLFDGPYIDWTIENNIVAVDHWHGISIYGGVNCKIVNNTVVDLNNVKPGPPWIRVNPTKIGEPSKNCIVRNNIAPSYAIQEGTTSDHNYKITDYNELFVDYAGLNLHLKAGAQVIDAGLSELSPDKDFDGNTRPSGKGVDIGAYEYQYVTVISTPVATPTTTSVPPPTPSQATTPTTISITIPTTTLTPTPTTTPTLSPAPVPTPARTPTPTPSTISRTTPVFSDVLPKHWAYEAIRDMVERGIVRGYPDKSFKPGKPVTRAEFVKIMVAALKLEQENYTNASFKDVSTDHWAFRSVESGKFYLPGYRTVNGDYYKPDEAAVREDIVAALVKALGYSNKTPDYSILEQYSDKDKISENLRKYIAIAVEHGIIKGYPAGTDGKLTFGPKRTLTRAEAARIMGTAIEIVSSSIENDGEEIN